MGGNTEVGIEVKFKAARYRHLAAPTHVAELTRMEARASRTPSRDCMSSALQGHPFVLNAPVLARLYDLPPARLSC